MFNDVAPVVIWILIDCSLVSFTHFMGDSFLALTQITIVEVLLRHYV